MKILNKFLKLIKNSQIQKLILLRFKRKQNQKKYTKIIMKYKIIKIKFKKIIRL